MSGGVFEVKTYTCAEPQPRFIKRKERIAIMCCSAGKPGRSTTGWEAMPGGRLFGDPSSARRFRLAYSIVPVEYATRLRLEEVKRLLVETNDTRWKRSRSARLRKQLLQLS